MNDVTIAGVGDLLGALDLVGDVMIAGVGDLLSDLESDIVECLCSTDDAGVMSSSLSSGTLSLALIFLPLRVFFFSLDRTFITWFAGLISFFSYSILMYSLKCKVTVPFS